MFLNINGFNNKKEQIIIKDLIKIKFIILIKNELIVY